MIRLGKFKAGENFTKKVGLKFTQKNVCRKKEKRTKGEEKKIRLLKRLV